MFKLYLMRSLLLILSLSTPLYYTFCMDQETDVLIPAKEEICHIPFLFRMFGLSAEVSLLPKDVQREIVKKLPPPFKPIRPKPTEIVHNGLRWNKFSRIAFNENGTKYAVCTHVDTSDFKANKLCIDSLTNPIQSPELITVESVFMEMAFSKDGTQLLCISEADNSNQAELFIVDDSKIVSRRVIPVALPCQRQFTISGLSDGTFLIVCKNQFIAQLEPTTDTLTILNPETSKEYCDFKILAHEESPVVICRELSQEEETPYLEFDVKTKTWSLLPGIVQEACFGPLQCAVYNADKSLLMTASSTGKSCLWDMRGKIPQLIRTLLGINKLCFRPDSSYALIYRPKPDFSAARLYSLRTGAYIVAINEDFLTRHRFNPQGDAIILCGPEGLLVWKWDPFWDECASFFEKPLLIDQYLFVKYLHQLSSCGLSLGDRGICARDKYKIRFSQIISPLTKQDIDDLKNVFLSFDLLIQKYLRLKYHLQAW